MTGWTALLELTRTCFRAPSFALFADLLFGWVCAPGRRTITAMIAVADRTGAGRTTPTTDSSATAPGP